MAQAPQDFDHAAEDRVEAILTAERAVCDESDLHSRSPPCQWAAPLPMHQLSTAIALVILCSACLKARLCGPSSTSSITSSPRTAGRSWRKMVPEGLETRAISDSVILNGLNFSFQSGSAFGTPIVCQRVAYTASTPSGAWAMSWCCSTTAPVSCANLSASASVACGSP